VTTAFDKLDYHLDGALRAGQPEQHAFAHIGLYLAWLIRHDLHNPDLLRDDWAAAVKAGEMSGSDLADAIDGALVPDLMTAEGAAFTAACYDDYLDDYAEAFRAEGDYAVSDDADAYARIAPAIDRRYADWTSKGRPARGPVEAELAEPSTAGFNRAEDVDDETLSALAMADFASMADEQGWVIETVVGSGPIDMPHVAADLERLLPRDTTRPPMHTSSVSASEWGDPLLKRALKRLTVDARACVVASGIGGEGQAVLTATIYAVPNVTAGDLEREFAAVIHLPPRGRWETREVGGKRVRWSSGRPFHVAFWALDGMVVHASASDAGRLEQLVVRLP
jgi:hypothetical protein